MDKVLQLSIDNPNVRIEVCRVGDILKLVLTGVCDCDRQDRKIYHVTNHMPVSDARVIPEMVDLALDQLLLKLRESIKNHKHEREHATTTGLRVRAKAVR